MYASYLNWFHFIMKLNLTFEMMGKAIGFLSPYVCAFVHGCGEGEHSWGRGLCMWTPEDNLRHCPPHFWKQGPSLACSSWPGSPSDQPASASAALTQLTGLWHHTQISNAGVGMELWSSRLPRSTSVLSPASLRLPYGQWGWDEICLIMWGRAGGCGATRLTFVTKQNWLFLNSVYSLRNGKWPWFLTQRCKMWGMKYPQYLSRICVASLPWLL